nr:receptor kinase-like protein Xa21 [Quercus suber]
MPEGIGFLSNLIKLKLSNNKLTGSIPPTLFRISTMESISLVSNSLSGSLPTDFGISLPNLKELYLAKNKLGGNLPSFIINASKLTVLDISGNLFTGYVPKTLGNLEQIQLLNLGYNNFTSEPFPEPSFIDSLANCKYLKILGIQSNPLNDLHSASLGNLSTSLEKIDASASQIKGKIPPGIGNLSNLVDLYLNSNEFIGPMPSALGRLVKLQRLEVQHNNLQGTIPTDLCGMKNLGQLVLSRNMLFGSIPSCLGNMSFLRYLSLDSNKLSSMIPSTMWSLENLLDLNLSSNSLIGNLLPEFGTFKAMINLDLSRNKFSGQIPSTIGDLQDLIFLSLAHNSLQGPIPQSFGKMVSLQSLDISHNNLSGEIPKTLEALIYLNHLDLSFNHLYGKIPDEGPFKRVTAQAFLGNDALCGAARLQVHPCHSKSKKTILILKYVLPIVVSTILIAMLISLLIIKRQRCKLDNPAQVDPLHLAQHRRLSYLELQQATENFDETNLLGAGSFGWVYKGILLDGMIVAVKVFNLEHGGALKSFEAESQVMRELRHRNLVKVITSCSNLDFKALVLEYMPKGSLEKWLYSHNNFLNVLQRLNIIIDVASALEYLHHGYSTPVVHCDIKPSNVLLDEDMVAHVGDFGIAKLMAEDEYPIQTMTLATIGYMAPEYGTEGMVSTRGDVYSYGIMIMETFTRKKPTDELFSGEMNLKRWVNESLHGSIVNVADATLLQREDEHYAIKEQCIAAILNLALDCTTDSPEERADMTHIVPRLKKIRVMFLKNIGEA